MKRSVQQAKRHEFTEAEWEEVCAEAGGFDGIAVVEYGHNAGDVWFTGYGPAPLDIDRPVPRTATNADVRAYFESRLWFVMDVAGSEDVVEHQRQASERAKAIATQAEQMIALLIDHRRARPILTPRDQSDPVCNLTFTDADRRISAPQLQIDLMAARDFYSRLADRYEETVSQYRLDTRKACREIYWGELIDFWTRILGRPATSSPTGPLTRFINAATAPMAGHLRPSENTIHRFARERLRLVQSAKA